MVKSTFIRISEDFLLNDVEIQRFSKLVLGLYSFLQFDMFKIFLFNFLVCTKVIDCSIKKQAFVQNFLLLLLKGFVWEFGDIVKDFVRQFVVCHEVGDINANSIDSYFGHETKSLNACKFVEDIWEHSSEHVGWNFMA